MLYPLVFSPKTLYYTEGVIPMVDVFYALQYLLHIGCCDMATVMVTLHPGGHLQH